MDIVTIAQSERDPAKFAFAIRQLGERVAGLPLFTPEQFGAVGDATTDDTTSLQRTINAAQTDNGFVLLTSHYRTSSALTVTSGIAIMGSGSNSLNLGLSGPTCGLQPDAGITAISVSLSPNAGVILRDFSINFASAAVANQVGIAHACDTGGVTLTAGSQINNIMILNAETAMSLSQFGGPGSIRNCYFLQYTKGITIVSASAVDSGDFAIEGNTFATSQATGLGIYWQSGAGVRIISNKFAGGAAGIDVAVASAATPSLALITANSFEGFTSYGVRFRRQAATGGFLNVVVNGNEFEANSPATACITVPTDVNGAWLGNFAATNNIAYQGTNVTFIDVDSTTGFIIANNLLRSGGGSKIVNLGSAADHGVVGPNASSGTTVASTIASTNTTTITPT